MNSSMPGLPVHHRLLEFTQTQVHPVGDAIQPSQGLAAAWPPGASLSELSPSPAVPGLADPHADTQVLVAEVAEDGHPHLPVHDVGCPVIQGQRVGRGADGGPRSP